MVPQQDESDSRSTSDSQYVGGGNRDRRSRERINMSYMLNLLAKVKESFGAYTLKEAETLDHARGPLGVDGDLPRASHNALQDAGQFCFVCLELGSRGQFAVKVPCLRPQRKRHVICSTRDLVSQEWLPTYATIHHTENAIECDSDVYERIRTTCFKHYGQWREWIPLYGTKAVEEVTFTFRGVVEQDELYPVSITSVDPKAIEEQANAEIALAERDDEDCCYADYHSQTCESRMDNASCIQTQADKARKRKTNLRFVNILRDCVERPCTANDERTLEGMALQSCIFDNLNYGVIVPERNKPYERTDEFLGIKITVGWQRDKMFQRVSYASCFVILMISGIWLCTAWWAGTFGDFGTAMAFGQLIAASLSLFMVHSKI